MRIKSVRICNILSIEDAFVQFDDRGLMLVEGWNHDIGRANGAGKTALFNAISFALFDKLPRKITATEILRRGCKSGFVEVCVEVGSDSYNVKRSRPKGVGFQKGGTTLDITQSEFEYHLGLNYNQFILSMYAAQDGSTRFLSINDSEKKQFLLQLLNLEEFSSCKTVADGKVKLLDGQLTALQSRIHGAESKISAYQESLIDEDIVLSNINGCTKLIEDLHTLLLTSRQVPKPDLSKYFKLEDDVATKKQEFAKARAKREMLHESFKKIGIAISSCAELDDRCRSCGNVIDTTAAKAAHERGLEQRRLERAEIKREIDELDTVLSRERGVAEVSAKIRDRKVAESEEYETARFHGNEVQSKIALRQNELKELNLRLRNNSDLQSKIKDLQAEREKLLGSGASISRDIELYKTVSSMYSPTGAQAYILDSVIDSFNDRVCDYVNLLWPNMTYELKSYKETVKGDVTAKFSELLMMDNKTVSIGSLSGGEFRALSLCVDFALIDVMERQFGISLSPIILDEPFNGLDGTGREFIVELLEKFSDDRQVVVIDHASEVKSMFSKVINVEKKNGVSTINLQL